MSASVLRGLRASLRLAPAAAEAATPMLHHTAAPAAWAQRLAQPTRHVATSRPAFSLADVLKKEMDFEAESKRDAEQPSALEAVPDGWTLDVTPGSTTMRLRRSGAPDGATIVISTSDQENLDEDEEDPDDEDGEASPPSYAISFELRCTKGDETLALTMTYIENDKEDPAIEHVACLPTASIDDEASDLFSGPQFGELDEGLQREFVQLAQERGVNAQVGQYLCQLVYDKEQDEYVRWMQRVHSFVSA